MEFFICISGWGEQQVVLAVPLATASDGGPGQRPMAKPEPPAVHSSKCKQGRLDVRESEKC